MNSIVKSGLAFLTCILCGSLLIAQCLDDNSFANITVTSACPGTQSITLNGGESALIEIVQGNAYTFSTCGNTTCDSYLTLSDGANNAYAWNDDGTTCSPQSEFTWVSTGTGSAILNLDEFPCNNGGCVGTTIDVTCSIPPAFSECGGAEILPANVSCTYQTFDNSLATTSSLLMPSNCTGFTTNDVWFQFTVPATGGAAIDLNAGTLTDASMAVYNPTAADCANLNNPDLCVDDVGADLMPSADVTYPAGTILFVRVWGSNGMTGTFDICITEQTPTITASDCVDAIEVCTNDGFTIDPNGVGAVQEIPASGSFGNPYDANPGGSGNMGCLQVLERNSTWMIVTIETTGDLEFVFGGGGQQSGYYDWIMYPYTATSCSDIPNNTVAPVRCNWNGVSSGGTGAVTTMPAGGDPSNYEPALPVVCGEQYIICFSNYSSSVTSVPVDFSGSATVNCQGTIEVTAIGGSICPGESLTLNAIGATNGYVWSGPNLSGTTGASVSAMPTGTSTYTVVGTSGCLTDVETVTVTVNPAATIVWSYIDPNTGAMLTGNPTVCLGQGVAITAAGSAQGYSWSPTTSLTPGTGVGMTVTATPAGILTYTVTGATMNNCPGDTEITVIVLPPPNLTLTDVAICFGGTANLAAAGATTYSWSGPNLGATIGSNVTATPTSTASYTVSGMNPGCPIDIAILTVTVNSITVTTNCTDETIFEALDGYSNSTTTGGTPTYSYLWNDGVTTQNNSGLAPGTHTVTVTDVAGCSAISSCITFALPCNVTLSASTTLVGCFGDRDGTATVALGASATSPFTYSWSDGQSTATAIDLSAGVYGISVLDAAGCTASGNATVTQPNELFVAVTGVDTKCVGSCDGTGTVTETGGTSPFTYLWANGSILNPAVDLCLGVNVVSVTDINGCEKSTSVIIGEPTPMVLDSVTVAANCNQSNGSGCVSATGGTSPYGYSWPAGETNSCIIGQFAGSYNVTVTDANGCTQSLVVVIRNLDGTTPIISDTTMVTCFGACDGSATVTMNGGISGFTIGWYDSGNTLISNTPNATNLCAGTYSAQVTDANGCASILPIVISQPTLLQITTGFTDPICFGYCDGTVSVTITGGTTPYVGAWSNGFNGSGATQTLVGLCDGAYSVNISDANGCLEQGNYVLTEPLEVTANLVGTDVLCFGACDGQAIVTPNSGITPYSYVWNDGQTTQAINGSCVGIKTVTVSDLNGCSTSRQTTINEPPQLSGNIDNFSHVTCYGANDGFIITSALGGTVGTGYTYLWNSGQSTASIGNLPIGSYSITITDANGCTYVLNQALVQPPELLLTITPVTNATCRDLCDGTATASASGGTTPYFYQWGALAGFQTNPNVTNLCANIDIGITVTDGRGCTVQDLVDITEPFNLTVSLGSDSSHCGLSDGMVSAAITGGTPGYSYTWSSQLNPSLVMASIPTIIGVPAGIYEIIATDTNGCGLDTLITISDILGPDVTGTPTPVTCFGDADGALNFNVNQGSGPFNFYWLYAGDTISSLTDVVSSGNLAGGNYSFIAVDAFGCKDVDVVNVSEPVPVQGIINNVVDATCFGYANGSANVIVAGGVGLGAATDYTYVWSDGQLTQQAIGLIAGNYTVSASDANGCELVLTTIIDEPPLLEISSMVIDATCFGSSDGSIFTAVTGGTPIYNYSWSPAQQPVAIITSLAAGTYNLTVTDINACTATSTNVVGQPDNLLGNLSMVPSNCTQCDGSATVVSPTGGTTPYIYVWSNGMMSTTATALCDIIYSCTLTDANQCQLVMSVLVTDLPAPSVVVTNTPPLCFGQSNGTATAVVTLGGGALQAGSPSWNDLGSQTGTTASNLTAGTYTVTVTDVNNCTATATTVIQDPPLFELIINASNPQLCFGESTQVYATPTGGTIPYGPYNWNAAASPFAGPTTSIFTTAPSASTTTFYGLTMVDGNGCVASDSVGVTVAPILTVYAPGPLEMCIGNNENICATAAGGQGINYTFIWSTGDTVFTPGSVTSCINVTPTFTTWYYVIITDGCTTPVLDSVQVIIHPLPPLDINSDIYIGCPPLAPKFTVNLGTEFPNATIQMDTDFDGVFDFNGPVDQIDAEGSYFVEYVDTFNTSGLYTYWAQVISEFGCINQTVIQDYITIYAEPVAAFAASPLELTLLDPVVNVNGAMTIGVTDPDEQMHWNFGDGTNGVGEFLEHTYQDTGSYTILLVVENDNGCMDTAKITLVVANEFILYIPTAFTPNGDGLNDEFFPEGVGINPNDFVFMIFNRWGEVIFETNKLAEHWDGTANAKGGTDQVQDGVYIWLIETSEEGKPKNERVYRGHVTLIR